MTDLDEPTLRLLQLRARELAKRGQVEERRAAGEPVAVVVVGGERLGLPVSSLVSIIRVPHITEVPELPGWMSGLVQIRGTLLTVVDISSWLGLPQRNAPAYLALLEESRRPLGILVEGVAGVREIFVDEIAEQRGGGESEKALPIRFTTRDLVAVLDIERLFAAMDQRHDQPTGNASHHLPGELP
jgi:purine-binding chemotaxis protein CheW